LHHNEIIFHFFLITLATVAFQEQQKKSKGKKAEKRSRIFMNREIKKISSTLRKNICWSLWKWSRKSYFLGNKWFSLLSNYILPRI